MISWNDIELSLPLWNAIDELGFNTPSKFQEVAFSTIAKGRNLICELPFAGVRDPCTDPWGAEKTAAYSIGTLAQVNPENNVQQVVTMVSKLGKYLNIGITMLKQDWTGTAGHVLVGTPRATLGVFSTETIEVDQIRCMVLDEATVLLNQ